MAIGTLPVQYWPDGVGDGDVEGFGVGVCEAMGVGLAGFTLAEGVGLATVVAEPVGEGDGLPPFGLLCAEGTADGERLGVALTLVVGEGVAEAFGEADAVAEATGEGLAEGTGVWPWTLVDGTGVGGLELLLPPPLQPATVASDVTDAPATNSVRFMCFLYTGERAEPG